MSISPPKLSPWLPVPGDEHCCMRIIEGGDPNDIADRVAFIEKAARVRAAPFTAQDDWKNWREGHRGSGGSCHLRSAEQQGIYGYDEDSRAWCDTELLIAGYELL